MYFVHVHLKDEEGSLEKLVKEARKLKIGDSLQAKVFGQTVAKILNFQKGELYVS